MLPTRLADLPLRARPLSPNGNPPHPTLPSRDPSQRVALPIVPFKIHYACRRRQLAFSSACDCCHGDGCVAMATWRGHIKEEGLWVTHEPVVSSSGGGVWRFMRCWCWRPHSRMRVCPGCHVDAFPRTLFSFSINHIILCPPLSSWGKHNVESSNQSGCSSCFLFWNTAECYCFTS